jgi:ankyrin repeat protein
LTATYGGTPLHSAAASGFPRLSQRLVALGLDVNAKENDGRTPLFMAASSGNYQIIKLLFDKGARCDVLAKDKSTPLHYSAMFPMNEANQSYLSEHEAEFYQGMELMLQKCGWVHYAPITSSFIKFYFEYI